MAMEFSYNDVLEHVELNNMLLAAKGWGVLSGLAVSERGAGANMSVDVASGSCMVAGTKYIESSSVNVAISAAHATLARKDIITYDTSAGNPAAVTGTAAAIPVPPDIPSGDILLALVDVPATDTAISNSQITDKIITVVRRGWITDGSLVLDTTLPATTWTDIDLSSYVGSNNSAVYLKVKCVDSVQTGTFGFRQNGDSDQFYKVGTDYLTMINGLGENYCAYTIVPTDSSGIIEYISLNSASDVKIWLIGYWFEY